MTGYDSPLYILPFDHRGSFAKGLLGIDSNAANAEQTAEIASYKGLVWEGFKKALDRGVPKDRAGVLVDEQFGAAVARDAKSLGVSLAMPVEKSGQDEFDFEYGDDFAAHIEDFDPTFAKVLVRYNTAGDPDTNARQAERLARLSDWLHANGRRYMFELLVPAEAAQLDQVAGDKKRYDAELRPGLMVDAIAALQSAGIEADVWKIEGIDDPADCQRVSDQARSGGRDRVGLIVLGRGENEQKVLDWLSSARGVPGYIGFAVGRTTFWESLNGVQKGEISEDGATDQIAANYSKWVDLFEGRA